MEWDQDVTESLEEASSVTLRTTRVTVRRVTGKTRQRGERKRGELEVCQLAVKISVALIAFLDFETLNQFRAKTNHEIDMPKPAIKKNCFPTFI